MYQIINSLRPQSDKVENITRQVEPLGWDTKKIGTSIVIS